MVILSNIFHGPITNMIHLQILFCPMFVTVSDKVRHGSVKFWQNQTIICATL